MYLGRLLICIFGCGLVALLMAEGIVILVSPLITGDNLAIFGASIGGLFGIIGAGVGFIGGFDWWYKD